MVLKIDTTNRDKIKLALIAEKQEKCFEFKTEYQPVSTRPSSRGGSEDLLVAIDSILKKEKVALKDIRAVAVNRGPGSFTGTRVGVTVANTLGWSLDIPVFGFKAEEEGKISAKIKKNQIRKFLKIVIPYYA